VSKQLFSIARSFPFWQDGSNYMGYPFSWSTVQIYYNPKFVKTKPDSWHALLDKRYRGKISLENIPTDMMAIAARATGAKKPYSMTTAEISRAKDFLKSFKPNVLKLASQNNEVVRALADGSAWIGITNLGTDDRVKDAGGPVVIPAYPKEGTIGFIDSEQIVKASKHKDVFEKFINTTEQAPWIAKNFLTNGRPLFNEKAWKILLNGGHGDRARRLLYNQPEKALKMTIKGPAGNEQAYVDAFNEVFGA
jgi:spermidine/putrescine-binding protein